MNGPHGKPHFLLSLPASTLGSRDGGWAFLLHFEDLAPFPCPSSCDIEGSRAAAPSPIPDAELPLPSQCLNSEA